jgi:hypothetical protein
MDSFKVELGRSDDWWDSGIPYGAGFCVQAWEDDQSDKWETVWQMKIGELVKDARPWSLGRSAAVLCDDNFGDPHGIIANLQFRIIDPAKDVVHFTVTFDSTFGGVYGVGKANESAPEIERLTASMPLQIPQSQ